MTINGPVKWCSDTGRYYAPGGCAGIVYDHDDTHLDVNLHRPFPTVKQARRFAEALIAMCDWKENKNQEGRDILPPKTAGTLVLARGMLDLIEGWGVDPQAPVMVGDQPLVNWTVKDGHPVLQTWEHYRHDLHREGTEG